MIRKIQVQIKGKVMANYNGRHVSKLFLRDSMNFKVSHQVASRNFSVFHHLQLVSKCIIVFQIVKVF